MAHHHEVADLMAENGRMKAALEKIERMKTYPSYAMNAATLCAARAIAREGLGIELPVPADLKD